MEEVEIITIDPPMLECEEGWANGRLLWRKINGVDVTPDPVGELIRNAEFISTRMRMSKEEYEKFYGKQKR